jgi:nucleotide-binding universal stress UspA family protein
MIPLKHKTVVVPVDFSDDSAPAIRAGLDRVESPDGLHVVHVLYPLSADVSLHGLVPATLSDATRESAARDRLAELLRGAGAPQAHPAVLTGDAGLLIADYAKRVGADLIIVPSHGYHGVKRLLLGSTAERVIRHADCSVLVLRRKDAE